MIDGKRKAMKLTIFLVAINLLLVLAMVTVVAQPADDLLPVSGYDEECQPAQNSALGGETVHIRFSTWHLPDSIEMQTVWIPMLEELKDRSDGRISYTILDGTVPGAGTGSYDMIAEGISDMGYATLTWTPGRFPLTDVLSLPASVECKDTAAEIGNVMYDRILRQEFPDVKVIELNGCISSYLWTEKPVHTMEDAKELKIRTPGGQQTNCIRAIGAEPVFMPLADVYTAVENGTVDGIVTCAPMILSYNLYEVVGYGTLATFGCVDEGVFMNQDSWESIPEDIKTIIVDVCRNPYRTTGGLTREAYLEMMEDINETGVIFYTLPPDEAERWYAVFQEETRGWARGLEAEGLPAKEAVRIFKEECETRGVECVAFPPEWEYAEN